MYARVFKRTIDIIGSLFLILMLSPVFIVLWIVIRFQMGTPVVFKQTRPGKDEKIFSIMKFRSMSDKRDASGQLLPDKDRITSIGRFIRKTSLDELPQLFNVLKGDMSFVGPRPLLMQYLPYYTEEEKLRHSVRPGITGLAQVNGRNFLSWDDKLALDVKYVKSLSLLLDLKILFLTALKVIKRKDIAVVPVGQFLNVERAEKQNKKD